MEKLTVVINDKDLCNLNFVLTFTIGQGWDKCCIEGWNVSKPFNMRL